MIQKKKYQKPLTKVHIIEKARLLAGSNPEFGYSPDINSNGEFNHLA